MISLPSLITSGFFYSDEGENYVVSYTFETSDTHPGLFEYELEVEEEESTELKEVIGGVLGYHFTDEYEGLCSWNQLPKMVKDEWTNKLSDEQIFQLGLISRNTIAGNLGNGVTLIINNAGQNIKS